MAIDSSRPAVHHAPDAGIHRTTLDPGARHLTVINTYTVAPERAEELLILLGRATTETLRYAPGFISANLHLNFDRTQVVNYSQWRDREALAAASSDPTVGARIREVAGVATSFSPIQYELRQSIGAPDA